jgi:hypothetical protein
MLTLCIWMHSFLVDVQHKLEADVQCRHTYEKISSQPVVILGQLAY